MQRPPLGTRTVLRANEGTAYGIACAYALPFLATSAAEALLLSVATETAELKPLIDVARAVGAQVVVEDHAGFVRTSEGAWNSVEIDSYGFDYAPAAIFISQLFPMGHIKSVHGGDEKFVKFFWGSRKWLKARGKQGKL